MWWMNKRSIKHTFIISSKISHFMKLKLTLDYTITTKQIVQNNQLWIVWQFPKLYLLLWKHQVDGEVLLFCWILEKHTPAGV